MEAGTFDCRTDRTLITLKLDVDEGAWLEVNEVLRVAYERIEDIGAEVANRTAPAAKTFRMTTSLLGYASPAQDADQLCPRTPDVTAPSSQTCATVGS
jgi:hypothetical protein